jgi:O-antigen/teichoic acid export membrane protein
MGIKLNTGYNIVGAMIPIALAVVTLPIYLRAISEARYGVLSIFWILLGYFEVFDFGMGRAVAHRLSALVRSTQRKRATVFTTALVIGASFGVIGTLILLVVAVALFGWVIDVDAALRGEVQTSLFWLAIAMPIAVLIPMMQGALQARERFLELNVISTIGNLLFQVVPLMVALFWSPDLRCVVPAAIVPRATTFLLLSLRCHHHVVPDGFAPLSRPEAGKLMSFGKWSIVTSLVTPLMTALDRLFISSFYGASAVARYAVPYQLSQRSTILASSLALSIFPRYAPASAEQRDKLTAHAIEIVSALLTPAMIVAIALAEPFFSWWIGLDFANDATPIAQAIMVGFWAHSFAILLLTRMQALGRADLLAKCHLTELVFYGAALACLLWLFGPVGAAWAMALCMGGDLLLLAVVLGISRMVVGALARPGLLVLGAYLAEWIVPSTTSVRLTVQLAMVIMALPQTWRVVVLPALRNGRWLVDLKNK